jgi:hypothetical protein
MSSNVKRVAEVIPVKKEDLQPSESPVVTWTDEPDNNDRLEWLLYVSKHYRDLLDRVLFDCVQLSNHNTITYLIDFDVLRSYLEANTKGYDSIFINSIFYESKQKYGIPIGAFQELLDYLSTITQTTHSITGQTDLPREESVRQIGAALGIKDSSQLDEAEAVEEISKRLEQKALSLTRLLNMLTDPRYIGVVSTYNERDKINLYEMLRSPTEEHHHRRKTRGTKINERDAMNLAIALLSMREAGEQKQKNALAKTSAYVLISKTFAVTDLPSNLLKQSEESEEDTAGSDSQDHLWKLCGMVGLDTKGFNLNMHLIPNYFPVMHPRRVINAELLGVYESPGNALTSATYLRNIFRKLTDHFSLQATLMKTVEGQNLYDQMTSILTQEQMGIEATFKEMARTMLSPKLGGLYELEQLRATSASVDYAHRLQQGDYAMSPEDEIKQKSTGLLELLGQVLSAFGDVPGFDYQLEVTPPDETRPYSEIKIGEQTLADGQKPFVFGEKYYQQEADPREQVYYALRWPVACPVNNFINGMTKFLVSRHGAVRMKDCAEGELPFSYVNDDSPVWDEGVVVYVNDRAFGLPFSPVLWNQECHLLDIPSVATSMRRVFESSDFLIQQYRINTSFGDFVFDIEPTEGEKTKYLTIISNYNLASQIAVLYKNTGMLCALPDKLSDTLSKALTEFETIPDAHQGGNLK